MAPSSRSTAASSYRFVMPRSNTPRAYFSFRSPYSWLAFHDLVATRPDLVQILDWRPFWEPDARHHRMLTDAGGDFLYTPMSREKHLYILGDVRRLAGTRGLSIKWPIDREVRWEIAHRAYLLARAEGRGIDFMARVYAARWLEGRNICDAATISDLAGDVGVDGTAAGRAADALDLDGVSVAALMDLWNDHVFGVPYFVGPAGRFWGIDRLGAFVATLGLAECPVRSDGVEPSCCCHWSWDGGHGGGCG
jgi:2-hydroxychromene-2-carboxylate isomerase